MAFLFLKLDVYQQANQFTADMKVFAKTIVSADAEMADQLRRASLSIPTNIAEGYGRWHTKDKDRFYFMALGSVTECASLLTSAHLQKMLQTERYEEWLLVLDRVAQMLRKLIEAVTRLSQ